MRYRYLRRCFALMLATVLTAGISFFFVKSTFLRLSAQDIRAFTATRHDRVYDRAGVVRLEETTVHAVRGDLSTVRARTLAKPLNRGLAEQRTIFDLSLAEEVSVDGLTESISSVPLSKQ